MRKLLTTCAASVLTAWFAASGLTGAQAARSSTGNPAMTVPLAMSRGGLPIGVQFAGRFGDEATLFRLGAQLETAQPWAGRRPSPVA